MTNELIDKITISGRDQISEIKLVFEAVSKLNLYSQKNAASTKEIANNAEQLDLQAKELMSVVDYFRIN
jgi:methyl-accepting chemotaxis protein